MASAFDGVIPAIEPDDVAELRDDLRHGAFFSPRNVFDLTTEEMAALLPFRGMVESWWKKLGEEILSRAQAGIEIPNYKMVEARSNRVFKSEKKVIEAVREFGIERSDLVTEKFTTPAALERLLKTHGVTGAQLGAILDPLVSKPPGNPTLAPLSDKRDALVSRHEDAFRDLTDDL